MVTLTGTLEPRPESRGPGPGPAGRRRRRRGRPAPGRERSLGPHGPVPAASGPGRPPLPPQLTAVPVTAPIDDGGADDVRRHAGQCSDGRPDARRTGRHDGCDPGLDARLAQLRMAQLCSLSQLLRRRLPDRLPLAGLAEHRAVLPLSGSSARLAGRHPPLGRRHLVARLQEELHAAVLHPLSVRPLCLLSRPEPLTNRPMPDAIAGRSLRASRLSLRTGRLRMPRLAIQPALISVDCSAMHQLGRCDRRQWSAVGQSATRDRPEANEAPLATRRSLGCGPERINVALRPRDRYPYRSGRKLSTQSENSHCSSGPCSITRPMDRSSDCDESPV